MQSSLVKTDEGCLGDSMFARVSLDLLAGRLDAELQPVDGQSQQVKVIVVDSMEAGRARAPVSGPGLRKSLITCLKLFPGCAPGSAFSQSVWSAGMS